MIFKGTFNQEEIQVDTFKFEVKNAKSIHFTLQDTAFEHALLIIRDTNHKIRAIFSYKTRVFEYVITSHLNSSSNLVFPDAILDGEWQIDVIKPYPIRGDYSFNVEFDKESTSWDALDVYASDFDELKDKKARWYRGDLHVHSMYSDGRVTHEVLIDAAREKQLDFLAVTEHSLLTTKFPNSHLLILPSTEITFDDHGHYNIHGLCQAIDYTKYFITSNTKSEVIESLLKDYGKQHVISINHPFPRGWDLKHDYDLRYISNIEVINAPHLFTKEVDNERAIQFFDYCWNQGHYLYGVGGSDAHKKNYFDSYPLGVPTTQVYLADGLSINNVLNAIKKGRLYIELNQEFEIIYHLKGNEKAVILPGDRVSGKVSMGARAHQVVTWELLRNGKVIASKVSSSFQSDEKICENEFYRLQARDVEGNIILFVNPIHNMKTEASEFSFQKVLKGFNDSEHKN